MDVASLLTGVRTWLSRTRCKWLLVMTVLCLALRENYPFSNFPMYSSFSQRTYFLYLTNAQGNPISMRKYGLPNSVLKKIFDRHRRTELQRFESSGNARVSLAEQAAAQSLLRYLDGLAATRPPARKMLSGLQVRHVRVQQEAHSLRLETRTLAQHR